MEAVTMLAKMRVVKIVTATRVIEPRIVLERIVLLTEIFVYS